eukprot:CAMPEP_0197576612 /NCGR_PEP_ID=MMETSP1326-20131121/1576_1 /TAXON_ID=1155430 /ORGANISM="Genus nov. species nov., Strain RCC2288" /LENGTH=79 /DNA_ID=CAMNT_0043139567 /DNA_START=152 /DNA_END=388 /DNA_ORIENTATION=+
MYPHFLNKARDRFQRAGISERPKAVYEPVPPPFVMADEYGKSPMKNGKGHGAKCPTGRDGGHLNIFSHVEFEQARDGGG